MPEGLRPHYEKELSEAHRNFLFGNLMLAWRHLERAHILGQPWAVEHTHVHWRMIQFGFRIKDWTEIAGQIPRLIVGGVKSFVGKIPVGNTGGANVPPLQPMEIPDDLKALLKSYGNS
jgi:Protein of unknown function (DUF3703)